MHLVQHRNARERTKTHGNHQNPRKGTKTHEKYQDPREMHGNARKRTETKNAAPAPERCSRLRTPLSTVRYIFMPNTE